MRWRSWALTDLPYVPVAVAMFLLLPAGHRVSVSFTIAAFAVFVLSNLVVLPTRAGDAVCLQPAFVLLLFAAPLNVIALLVPVSTLISYLSHRWRRSPLEVAYTLGDNWYCVAPALVLGIAASGGATPARWPIYMAALIAQFAFEAIAVAVRWRRELREIFPDRASLFLAPAIDACLTPVGLAAAVVARQSPAAAIATILGVIGVLSVMAQERKDRLLSRAPSPPRSAHRPGKPQSVHGARRRVRPPVRTRRHDGGGVGGGPRQLQGAERHARPCAR